MHRSGRNRLGVEARFVTMIVAFISDENYVGLPGVAVEFTHLLSKRALCFVSSASGAVHADLEPGRYRVVLSKEGYGAKWGEHDLNAGEPLQLRMLSDAPVGFMWPKWVRSGERSEIRAHAAEQYQLSLWRYGLRKESYGVISWFDEHGPFTMRQILPDADFTQTGVQWNSVGYPSPHPQQSVVAPARSGLYYMWGRTLSGRRFSFPWVVAPSEPKSRVAVMANTNTWNAYNAFGGRSNYINPAGLRAEPTINARQDLGRYQTSDSVWLAEDETYQPLSFERPEPGNEIFDNTPWDERGAADPIQGRLQCGQAPGEWRLFAWLEREGFEYDLYAEAQLHDGTLDLSAYKVLMLGVHPEYWSRTMFDRVDHWVRGGGRLMYLGGNGLNCEVLFPSETVMRCLSREDFTENEKNGNESRMHRTWKPEATLLGVAFSNFGAMTAAPYAVRDDSHWAFRGTGLRKGDSFGSQSLHERVPGGASGHETDKMTRSSPAGRLLAQGLNRENGGADLVIFPLDKGCVFSTGSITWVSSLFPDQHVSQITRNVLEVFLNASVPWNVP
ncbi:MAG TPA: carboxypeptidase-like regulatory domain-containing protein [Bryocella sp.]|nr:carboxypeptidase-like regulatory domain-containing protein [Bryocella sp.]